MYGVCAFDDPNNRTLSGRYEVNEEMTIEMCLSICRDGGYPYAGLKWQIECFCGDEPDSGFIWRLPKNCNKMCAGDSNQNCGGSNAISIWSTPPAYLTGQCFRSPERFRQEFRQGYRQRSHQRFRRVPRDFAFSAQTSVHSKIFFREKFRSYTSEPVFELGYSIDGLEDLTPEKCIDICLSVEGTDLILNLVVF